MKHKLALLVIYNHRYDKNIPRVEEIYRNRFEHVYHIVPFYDGDKQNVIAVYESSYYFQGYIVQAYQQLKDKGFTHYIAVADDMVIHPELNENNFFERSGIDETACFVPEVRDYIHYPKWFHAKKWVSFSVFNRGLEIDPVLPTKAEAEALFQKRGLSWRYAPEFPYANLRRPIKEALLHIRRLALLKLGYQTMSYPLVGGYSDMMVIPATVMPKFCQYCGAFVAANLFVEVAVPTTMVFVANKLQTLKDIRLNKMYLEPRERHNDILSQHNRSYKALVDNYPDDMLLIHPIKLSQWK